MPRLSPDHPGNPAEAELRTGPAAPVGVVLARNTAADDVAGVGDASGPVGVDLAGNTAEDDAAGVGEV